MIEEYAQKNIDFINQQIKSLQQQKYFYEQVFFFDTCIKLFKLISLEAEDNVKQILVSIDDKFSSNDAENTIHLYFNKRKIVLAKSFADYSLNFDKTAWTDITELVQFKKGLHIDNSTTVQSLIEQHSYPLYNTQYLSLKLEKELTETIVHRKQKL